LRSDLVLHGPSPRQRLPFLFLALLAALHGARPNSYLVSIRGHAFDFEQGLTAGTAALVEPAVDAILDLLS
jgi:hypothetical protein